MLTELLLVKLSWADFLERKVETSIRFMIFGSRTYFSDSNGIRTRNQLVRKWTLNHPAKLASLAK